MFRQAIKTVVKAIGAEPQAAESDTAWVLTIDLDTEGHGREGFGGGWPMKAFSTPSAAEVAAIEVAQMLKVCHDILEDDLVRNWDDRVKKVAATKEWQTLCRLYPMWFGSYPVAQVPLRGRMTKCLFEVVAIPKG